jgi:hypothetical protein
MLARMSMLPSSGIGEIMNLLMKSWIEILVLNWKSQLD